MLKKVDRLIGPRIEWAASGRVQWWAALAATAAGCMMPPLELLPFVAALPAAAVLLFGLGLTARDGLLMIAGFALTGAAAIAGLSNLTAEG